MRFSLPGRRNGPIAAKPRSPSSGRVYVANEAFGGPRDWACYHDCACWRRSILCPFRPPEAVRVFQSRQCSTLGTAARSITLVVDVVHRWLGNRSADGNISGLDLGRGQPGFSNLGVPGIGLVNFQKAIVLTSITGAGGGRQGRSPCGFC